MKPMMRIAMPALAALVLAACGGGGGGMAPAMPEAPAAAVPVVVAEPELEGEPEPVAEPVAVPEPLPDPATLLQSHDRLSLPDGFNAVLADEAMFLLANIPYREAAGGAGAGLAAASLALQAGAYALYTAERSAAYSPDHAVIEGPWVERVARVKPEVTTGVVRGAYIFDEGGQISQCHNDRGECRIVHPHPALRGAPQWGNLIAESGAHYVRAPVADMPFVSNAMREQSEGVRERGGVGLRYWSASGEVPWLKYRNRLLAEAYATETWSGYGAWQDWSGFGLVMLAHNHQWDLFDSAWHHFIAGGDLTGSQPEITGTMRGAAVAQLGPGENDLGTLADGAVEMTVRLGASPSFDISIGDWRGYNLTERGEIGLPATVSIRELDMRNIPIKADGTFGVTEDTAWNKAGEVVPRTVGGAHNPNVAEYQFERVTGAFYGPEGGEAAGIFDIHHINSIGPGEQEWVYGAFGVRKPKK